MDSRPRPDDHTVDSERPPGTGTYDELVAIDPNYPNYLAGAREVLQWWNGLTDVQRHHYEYIGFKRYGASEGLHEASDAHLYGRCDCLYDPDDSSSIQHDDNNE